MILNFLLLAGIYAARNLESRGYLITLVIGAIKGVIYLIATDDILFATIIAAIVAAVSSLIHFLLFRLTAKQVYVPYYSVPSAQRTKRKIQWEYAPLGVLFVAFVFALP